MKLLIQRFCTIIIDKYFFLRKKYLSKPSVKEIKIITQLYFEGAEIKLKVEAENLTKVKINYTTFSVKNRKLNQVFTIPLKSNTSNINLIFYNYFNKIKRIEVLSPLNVDYRINQNVHNVRSVLDITNIKTQISNKKLKNEFNLIFTKYSIQKNSFRLNSNLETLKLKTPSIKIITSKSPI